MSSATANPIELASPAAAGAADDAAAEGPARSYAAQVLRRTFAGLAPRVALGWIGLLVFLAVFAPFLASSQPYLIEVDGRWSSPLWRALTWVDLTLVAATAAAAVLGLSRRARARDRAWVVLAAALLVAAGAFAFKRPPVNVVYEQYRDAARAGRVGFVLNAPIPYSASDRLRDQPQLRLSPPGPGHRMGTELNGGDVLSRLVHACRLALSIGFVATGIAIVIGVAVGGVMGYFSGVVDILGMRAIEVFEAIPTLFLMITIVAFFSGESYRLYLLMAIIGCTGWTGYARFVRAEFLSLRDRDFVHAAIAAGLPLRSVLFRHMLPNGITAVVISASYSIAGAIVSESTLSFLDLGLIDQPSWGQMLSQAIGAGGNFLWWLAVFPGAAIFLTVFAYNMVGEALADALDPKRNRV